MTESNRRVLYNRDTADRYTRDFESEQLVDEADQLRAEVADLRRQLEHETEFYEDDEPIEKIQAIADREPDGVTTKPIEHDKLLIRELRRIAETMPTMAHVLTPAALEVESLQTEVEEYHQLITRQGDLLTGVAKALRGDPPPLTMWDHSDLPTRAMVMTELANVVLARVAMNLHDADRIEVETCLDAVYNEEAIVAILKGEKPGGRNGSR